MLLNPTLNLKYNQIVRFLRSTIADTLLKIGVDILIYSIINYIMYLVKKSINQLHEFITR